MKQLSHSPPPPSVEDEAESLAKEHEPAYTPAHPEEEPSSRGELEQSPIIMDVHEFNPERRFIMVENVSSPRPKPAAEKDLPHRTKQQESTPRQNRSRETSTKGIRETDAQPTPAVKVSSQQPIAKPVQGEIREHLPSLQTKLSGKRPSLHFRSQSATDLHTPTSPAARENRKVGESHLSPEVIIASPSGRREKAYYDYSQPPTSKYRPDDRRSERGYDHRDMRSTPARRDAPFADGRKPLPRTPTDRVIDSKTSEEHTPIRREERGISRLSGQSTDKRDDALVESHCKDGTRSDDDVRRRESQNSSRRRRYSNVIEHERVPVLRPGKDSDKARPRSKAPTSPLASPRLSTLDVSKATKPRTSGTCAGPDGARRYNDLTLPPSPYPTEDDQRQSHLDSQTGREGVPMPQPRYGPTMPTGELPPTGSRQPDSSAKTFSSSASTPATPAVWTTPTWLPPSFDPYRDGTSTDRPSGSYRRHSENQGEESSLILPECPRKRPVAGYMDWLTLPRTDFTVCPSCYTSVFDKPEYRSEFRPMLKPTERPVACDFGLCPWYRIAWLLILKNNEPDLRLLRQISNVIDASKHEPCPGNRRTGRNWCLILYPQTRRPVAEFTACYQCATVIETIFPNLAGAFAPDSRAERLRSVCSLHFAPARRLFVLFFDVFETSSDKALDAKRSPNITDLAQRLERLSLCRECRADTPVSHGYWHTMQFLPDFTVCAECFKDMVEPRLKENNIIARNFHIHQQQRPSATCQLYSPRMRDIFQKACRRNDPKYLEDRVRERMDIELAKNAKLKQLERHGVNDARTREQIDKLLREWKRWE